MRMRYGIHKFLDEEATKLIAQSTRGQSLDERSDVLSPSQEARRKSREVYVSSGTPDPALRVGTFGKVANTTRPDLNSREGRSSSVPNSRTSSRASSPTSEWVSGFLDGKHS